MSPKASSEIDQSCPGQATTPAPATGNPICRSTAEGVCPGDRSMCGSIMKMLCGSLWFLAWVLLSPQSTMANWSLGVPLLEVREGAIASMVEEGAGLDLEKDAAALWGIPGRMKGVMAEADSPANEPNEADSTAAAPPPSAPAQVGDQEASAASVSLPLGWLPVGHLFSPLLADPRWPHFSASYNYHIHDKEITHVGAVSLGEIFSLFRFRGPFDGQSELGIQTGVFAIFDLAAESHDLVNADYWVALHSAYRMGQASAMARVYHQSSHLGDEFLLRGSVKRLDLSLEAVDLKLSYDLPRGFRLYGGGAYIFNQKETDIKRWATQAGLEFRSPWASWEGRIRPVGAVDIKNQEENGWRPDLSVRAGIQFDSVEVLGRNLELLLQYYDGYSPDGQFYKKKTQYLGLGAHFHL